MVNLYPPGVWHPLGGEVLQLLNGMVRGMGQKGADKMKPLVVGKVRCRLLGEGLPVQVLSHMVR
jgi:hypothetical protein